MRRCHGWIASGAHDPERSLRLRRSAGPPEREDHLLAAWRQGGSV
jgi:hypothetical protein